MKRLAWLYGFVAITAAAVAGAAEPAAGPAGRRMQMEAVTAADFQQIEGGPLLLAAYAVVWAVFFLAALSIFWRLRKVTAELRRLESRMGPTDGKAP